LGKYADYPNLYFLDLNKALNVNEIFDRGTCIKTCPAKKGDKIECKMNNKTESLKKPAIPCLAGYDSTDIVGYCLPTSYDAF